MRKPRSLRGGPHDPELSPFLNHRNHLHPALHRLQDAVSQQPAHNWNLAAMANVAHTSPRHLTRVFIEHAGIAPLQCSPSGGAGGSGSWPQRDWRCSVGWFYIRHAVETGVAGVRSEKNPVKTNGNWPITIKPKLRRSFEGFSSQLHAQCPEQWAAQHLSRTLCRPGTTGLA